MLRPSIALATLCLAFAGCASKPHLTQDARLVFDPNHMPDGTQYKKTTPEEWAREAAEICARPGFQCINTPIDVSLIKEDGSSFHMTATPPIMTIQNDASIYIMAGQTLYIEADVGDDGKLKNLKLVPQVMNPEKTLVISLKQEEKPTKTLSMTLDVKNPFDKALRYHAGMMVLDGPDGAIYATDTCPVMAKIRGLEFWPMPVFQVLINNPALLEPSDKLECGY